MSSERYTPTEWRVESGEVVDEQGRVVARADRSPNAPFTPVERDHNMTLCAATPQLVNACFSALSLLKRVSANQHDAYDVQQMISRLREAVAVALLG